MKNYRITIDGTSYFVEVETVGSATAQTARMQQPAARPATPAVPVPPAAPAPAPAAAPTASTEKAVTSPMPGTILEVKVSAGQSVTMGDTLVVLEAMKMENEIPAPQDGIIDTVAVAKGASVNSGELLITFK